MTEPARQNPMTAPPLVPEFLSALRAFLADAKAVGLYLKVLETIRTVERQAWLYAAGRTDPSRRRVTNLQHSRHQDGTAADVVPTDAYGKTIDWNGGDEAYMQMGALAESNGLEWGGRWISIKDWDHVQLPVTATA